MHDKNHTTAAKREETEFIIRVAGKISFSLCITGFNQALK